MNKPHKPIRPTKPAAPEKMTTSRGCVSSTVVLETTDEHCYECGGWSTSQASIADLELLIQQMRQLATENATNPDNVIVKFFREMPLIHFDELKINAHYAAEKVSYDMRMKEYRRKLKVYNEKNANYEKQLAAYNSWKAKNDLAKAQKRLKQAQKQVDNLQQR